MIASMHFFNTRLQTPSYLQMPFAEKNAYLNNVNFRVVHESIRNEGFPISNDQSAFENARNQREIALGIYNPDLQHVLSRHNYGKSRL
jgi:hypothetical protein